jgi:signal transduction histidine kinase/CheY-like chemotaxis protein
MVECTLYPDQNSRVAGRARRSCEFGTINVRLATHLDAAGGLCIARCITRGTGTPRLSGRRADAAGWPPRRPASGVRVIRALVDRIEPTLGPEEERYRLHFLRTDRAQAAVGGLMTLALMALVFAFEFTFVGERQLVQITVVRVAFLALSFVILVAIRGIESPAALDRAGLIWMIGFATQFIALTALRPASPLNDVGIITIVLAFYLLAPTPLVIRTGPALFVSVGFMLVLWLVRKTPPPIVVGTAGVVAAMNVFGIWASARQQTQRRRQYQSQESLHVSVQERDALIDTLRQSRKMESMGRIVGGVAHDFNNILGAMLASVEFLLEDLPGESASRADAETLRKAVQRGADLTHQLLAFSRQQVLEPRVVSLNALVSDTQRMLIRTIGEDIAIGVSLGESLSSVRVDPGQIQQILLNLSVNARDAMPAGGTLTIQTRNVTLDESTPMSHSVAPGGAYVVLKVSDDGTGMSADVLAQIFEPFFTTKPKGRGTGLGLSTVFGIVEQSGGHIRVASVPGHGTTFEIFLPAVAERPLQDIDEPRDAPLPLPRGSETILLAEDDEELRALTARVLTAQGYRVLEASDGLDALRVAEDYDGSLDLLATDMVMPSMGGPALARKLSARRPGLKVLFMSGYTDDAVGRGELGPRDAFLQKPVDPAMLARKVRQVLDGDFVG